jgi:hypothetical protein
MTTIAPVAHILGAAPLHPTFEVFEITASSDAQDVDAGWYYWINLAGDPLGDPQGPFACETAAHFHANANFIG